MRSLLDRLASHPRVSMRREALSRIEQDVCSRLSVTDSSGLSGVKITAFPLGGRARNDMHVVSVKKAKRNPLGYCLKDAHRSSEAEISQRASEQGIGPRVLDVFGAGLRAEILEEYFPKSLNFHNRRIREDERQVWGEHLSRFFLKFVDLDGEQLIYHNDERPEHIFILGQGKEIEVRLIDWGRGGCFPLKVFDQWWAAHQFSWFYEQLSYYDPFIWQTFVNSLAQEAEASSKTRKYKLAQRLGLAYVEFFKSRTYEIWSDNWYKDFAIRFLEVSQLAQPLDLDLGLVGNFLQECKSSGLTGQELSDAFARWWRSNRSKVKVWVKLKKSEIIANGS